MTSINRRDIVCQVDDSAYVECAHSVGASTTTACTISFLRWERYGFSRFIDRQPSRCRQCTRPCHDHGS
jgi:hypothetical protein